MVATIVFSATACGQKADIQPAEQVTAEESVEETTEEVTEEVTEEASEEVSAEESDDEFTSGVVNGNTYENSFFNVAYTIDDDMVFLDEEQLAQVTGTMSDMLSDNKAMKEQLDSGAAAIVAYAVDQTGTKTFNVTIQSLNAIGSLLSEKTLVEASMQQAETMLAQTYDSYDYSIDEVELFGEKHYITNMTVELQGTTIYQRQAYILKGSYYVALTVSATTEEELDAMFENLTLLNE